VNLISLVLVLGSSYFAYLLLFNFQRQKLSYYYNIRSLFYAWCILFILVAYLRIIFSQLDPIEGAVYRTKTSIAISSLMTMIFGSLAAILGHYTDTKSLREFLSRLWKQPYLPVIVYYAICLLWAVLGVFTTPFSIIQLKSILTGDIEYAAIYEPWYKSLMILVAIAVFMYPCFTLFKSSRQMKDRKVKKSLRIFFICLVLYTITSPLLTFIRTYGYSEYELIYFSHMILLAVMWYGFKEATVFSEFFEKMRYISFAKGAPVNVFSRSLGLKHEELVGRKILLEFEATSDYERVVHDFVIEALSNKELVAIFTRRGSSIYSSLNEEKGVKFFCLTQQVSVPTRLSETETLLSSNDTSVMLSLLNEISQIKDSKVVNVVFDNLSDLVLTIGLEKTYYFVKNAAEILASPKITGLFLVNALAHSPAAISSLRGLFSNQIYFGKKGMQAIKLERTVRHGE